jgi:hypothetical protein
MKGADERRHADRSGLLMAGALGLLGALWLVLGHTGRGRVFLLIATGVAALVLLAPPAWLAVFRVWTRIARWLGLALTMTVLVLIYALLVTPIGWWRRLRGHLPLDTRWPHAPESEWIAKQSAPRTIERYERPF